MIPSHPEPADSGRPFGGRLVRVIGEARIDGSVADEDSELEPLHRKLLTALAARYAEIGQADIDAGRADPTPLRLRDFEAAVGTSRGTKVASELRIHLGQEHGDPVPVRGRGPEATARLILREHDRIDIVSFREAAKPFLALTDEEAAAQAATMREQCNLYWPKKDAPPYESFGEKIEAEGFQEDDWVTHANQPMLARLVASKQQLGQLRADVEARLQAIEENQSPGIPRRSATVDGDEIGDRPAPLPDPPVVVELPPTKPEPPSRGPAPIRGSVVVMSLAALAVLSVALLAWFPSRSPADDEQRVLTLPPDPSLSQDTRTVDPWPVLCPPYEVPPGDDLQVAGTRFTGGVQGPILQSSSILFPDRASAKEFMETLDELPERCQGFEMTPPDMPTFTGS